MKLKFDPNLEYQLDAIQSIVDIFDGQPLDQGEFEVSLNDQVGFIEQKLGLLIHFNVSSLKDSIMRIVNNL